jgi:predicted metal-dependent phosphoesterase TrpH
VILDLHIHTSWNSADSNLSPLDLILEAKRLGLDGVVVTEHDRCWDRFAARQLAAEHEFLFLRGMEVSTDLGHILVYGLEEYVSGIMRAEKLRQVVDEAGGVMVAAHPFRRIFTRDFRNGREAPPRTLEEAVQRPIFALTDGIEVCNGGSIDRENKLAMEVCDYLGQAPTGGSDAHSDHGIGYYATQFDATIHSEADVIAALKQRRCRAVMLHKGEAAATYEVSRMTQRYQCLKGWHE